ncbi:MAG: hypothetical protein IJE95_05080 [Methanocorpusculum sp.]|nr:hypothetical protein [Methanocorpusculum sp.]
MEELENTEYPQTSIGIGDLLWGRQTELDKKYLGIVWFDGGATWSLLRERYYLKGEEEELVKAFLKYINGRVKYLKNSTATFKKLTKADGDEWRKNLSEEMKTLPKEEVVQMFNEEYTSLLEDYKKLKKQIKEQRI